MINFLFSGISEIKEMTGYAVSSSSKITYKNNILYIQLLEEKRITKEIFENILMNVYCYDLWVNGEKSFLKDFKDCKALVVMNKWNYQSIIYKGGYELIKELGTLPNSGGTAQNLFNIAIAYNTLHVTGYYLNKTIKEIENEPKNIQLVFPKE